mgnify:CR=1 FL=1
MISDEERREAAARLRAQADKLGARNPDGLYTAADLMLRLFHLVGAPQSLRLHGAFRFIADLIDRPMTHNTADPHDGSLFECSNCGEIWELACGNPADNHLNFCPRCGAEVIAND